MLDALFDPKVFQTWINPESSLVLSFGSPPSSSSQKMCSASHSQLKLTQKYTVSDTGTNVE